jgi:hypothetical protein
VITVGATNDRETPAVDDDHVPLFSGRGSATVAKPDVVAPGTRLVSVLPPGTTIETILQGKGLLPLSGYYRRASGTSMSAVVVSGVAALLLDAHPDWTPGQVKAALRGTTRKVGLGDPLAVGKGMVDAYAANQVPAPIDESPLVPRSNGSGSLHNSRGTLLVQAECDPTRALVDMQCGKPITGDTTAQGDDFKEGEYAGSPWDPMSWDGSQWNDVSLFGTSWYGTSWYGTSWYAYEADQGEAWDGNAEADTIGGVNPPASGIYGLWR